MCAQVEAKEVSSLQKRGGLSRPFGNPTGISTDPAKIEVIQDWPTPKEVSNGCSGLRMFGYY